MADTQEMKSNHPGIGDSFNKAIQSFAMMFPILLGVVLLIGLFKIYVTPQMISSVFRGDVFFDAVVGSVIGSISAGNPITSYIIGGELLQEGVSLFAVTAFIISWVTVRVIQLPAEASILGKRFALVRNALSFVFSILVALITVLTVQVIG